VPTSTCVQPYLHNFVQIRYAEGGDEPGVRSTHTLALFFSLGGHLHNCKSYQESIIL
jgi:hypothetical protein